MAAISLADDPCATARQGIKALRASDAGQIVMMTRDRRTVALRIAPQLGIKPDDVDAALLPQDKVALVDQFDKHGSGACVGDEVNDAAALARADVVIAMGAARSEAALQAADVARMAAAPSGPSAPSGTSHVAYPLAVPGFAIGAMVVLVTSGMFFHLSLPPAVLGDEGGRLLVVLNGLRLQVDAIATA